MTNKKKISKENLQEITEHESSTIYYIKAFAILSVIAAHVSMITKNSQLEEYITSTWNIIGQIGVICFFTLGGFLYTRKTNDNKPFWEKKFHKLIIPWLICSTLTYIIEILLSGKHATIIRYIKWICGSGTWYYYITVFLFCLFIFKYLYKSNFLLILAIIINIFSIIAKTANLSTNIEWHFLTDYLNPLNWIGYFSFGIIIRKYRLDKKIYKNSKVFIIFFLIALITTHTMIKYQIFTYFHILSLINSIASFFALYYISYWLSEFKFNKHIKKIGTSTYCIYLLHMQIVQYFTTSLPNNIIKHLFSPILSLILMMILINIGIYICKKLPFGKTIKNAVGLNE